MKSIMYFLGLAALGLVLIVSTGCTKSDEQQADDEERGRIEQMTDQAAEKVEKKIQTPLDRARSTKDLGDDRLEEMDKAMQKQ